VTGISATFVAAERDRMQANRFGERAAESAR
jgi:hypothetical protein